MSDSQTDPNSRTCKLSASSISALMLKRELVMLVRPVRSVLTSLFVAASALCTLGQNSVGKTIDGSFDLDQSRRFKLGFNKLVQFTNRADTPREPPKGRSQVARMLQAS